MSTAAAVAIQRNPFPGLRPFREDEEYLFFGRESQVDAMVDKLAATHFLAVVGTSGSGKSSLVNSGLRPALHGGLMARAGTSWRMAQFRPGSDPLGAMARALAEDGVLFRDYQAAGLTLPEIVDTTLRMSKLGLVDIFEQAQLGEDVNLLVVVDQFEELFRYRQLGAGQQENIYEVSEEATAFVNLLLEAKNQTTCPIYVVLTMRSDFLGDCAHFPGLAEAINVGQYLVPRMTRDERRGAISGPVGVGGAEISPVLLTRLVNDVGDNPDQLSILQHALNRTWARWANEGGGEGPLDLAHYQAIGTMAHALDQHAEQAYGELDTARQQQICEKLFKALTDKATDPRGVRRPTTLGILRALADATEVEVTDVIDVFRDPSRSFLMPPAGGTLQAETVVDISHESLMRVWQRLNTWANEEALSAGTFRRLADTAVLHAAGKASLWRDPDLQLALDWRDRTQPNETWASRYHPEFSAAMGFLQESSEAREAELAWEAERRRREVEVEREKADAQARHARRMRWAAVFSGALAVVAVVFGLIAFKAWNNSKEQTRISEKQTRIALSRQLTSQTIADLDRHFDRALLFSLEAERLAATEETEMEAWGSLLAVTAHHPYLDTFLHGHDDGVVVVAFSPDGKRLASASIDKTIRLWDVRKREPLGGPLTGHDGWVMSVAFSPNGKLLASGSMDGTIRLWDAANGQPIGELLTDHTGGVMSVAFSPDGVLASGSEDGTIVLWDVATRTPLEGDPLTGHEGGVTSVAFSPDGKLLASGSDDGTILLWDVAKREFSKPLTYHDYPVMSVAFSPDGKLLASGGLDGTIRLWDVESGKSYGEDHLYDVDEWVWSVAFSPDGKFLAAGVDDHSILLWNVVSEEPFREPLTLTAHGAATRTVAFSRDGTLVSGSWDGSIALWDLDGKQSMVQPLVDDDTKFLSVAFSPNPEEKLLASGSDDGTIVLWVVAKRERLHALTGHDGGVMSVEFSPDGKLLASGSVDKTILLWDVAKRRRLGDLTGHDDWVTSVAFSPDGKLLASGSDDKTIMLWNVAKRTPLGHPLTGHTGEVMSVAFSPDGKLLASCSVDKTILLWDVAKRERLGDPLTGHAEEVFAVAFSPDGKLLASASNDQTIRLWENVDGNQPRSRRLFGHWRGCTSVAFSADGRLLASTSDDGTIRLWDVASGEPLGQPLTGHATGVMRVAFSPDGNHLASVGGYDEGYDEEYDEEYAYGGELFLWDFSVDSWKARACRRANRNLTESEWDQFIGPATPYHITCPELHGR